MSKRPRFPLGQGTFGRAQAHILPLFLILGLFLGLFLAAPAQADKGLTCDFYDIVEIPDGWKVSISPGLNNADNRTLGHYYNRARDSSVLIQVDKANFHNDIEAVANKLVAGFRQNGAKILAEPAPDGPLMRLEATLTGAPAVVWVGTKDELSSLTILTGDMDACREFLSLVRNADPLLIPTADMVPARIGQ